MHASALVPRATAKGTSGKVGWNLESYIAIKNVWILPILSCQNRYRPHSGIMSLESRPMTLLKP